MFEHREFNVLVLCSSAAMAPELQTSDCYGSNWRQCGTGAFATAISHRYRTFRTQLVNVVISTEVLQLTHLACCVF